MEMISKIIAVFIVCILSIFMLLLLVPLSAIFEVILHIIYYIYIIIYRRQILMKIIIKNTHNTPDQLNYKYTNYKELQNDVFNNSSNYMDKVFDKLNMKVF